MRLSTNLFADWFVLYIYDFLTLFYKVTSKRVDENKCANEERLSNLLREMSLEELLSSQHMWKDIAFGRHNAGKCGCGAIAVCNALCHLEGKEQVDIPRILGVFEAFETSGVALGGGYGISPKAIGRFWRKLGYHCEFIKQKELRQIEVKQEETYIATVFNQKNNLFAGMHTVCITKEQERFVVHNVYNPQKRCYEAKTGAETLVDALNQIGREQRCVCLFRISK